MIKSKSSLILLAAFIAASPAWCEFYRWKDKSGRVQMGNNPPSDVPAGTKVERVKGTATLITPAVELYTASWCSYCMQARNYLNRRKILFSEFDVETDPAAADRAEAFGWRGGVPFAVFNGQSVHGFSPERYNRLLTEALPKE
jgi:glutaredoxin